MDRVAPAIAVEAGAEWIPAREQLASRGPAQRLCVAVFEAGAAGRQRIQVRCLDRSAGTSDIAKPHIVGQDHNDVWLATTGGYFRCGGG